MTALIAVMVVTGWTGEMLDATADPGLLGGRFYEEESGREVVYRSSGCPLRSGLGARRRGIRIARYRRRHPESAAAQRLVRRPASRGRSDERTDDR